MTRLYICHFGLPSVVCYTKMSNFHNSISSVFWCVLTPIRQTHDQFGESFRCALTVQKSKVCQSVCNIYIFLPQGWLVSTRWCFVVIPVLPEQVTIRLVGSFKHPRQCLIVPAKVMSMEPSIYHSYISVSNTSRQLVVHQIHSNFFSAWLPRKCAPVSVAVLTMQGTV